MTTILIIGVILIIIAIAFLINAEEVTTDVKPPVTETKNEESKGERVLTEHIQHIVDSDTKKTKLTSEEIQTLEKIAKKAKRKRK